MTRYDSVSELAQAIRAGEVPTKVVSPGLAAEILGVSRQAVWQRIQRGTLRCWGAEGVLLIDVTQLPMVKLDSVKDGRHHAGAGRSARGARRPRP